MAQVNVKHLFDGKKGVLVGFPGAFTDGCSEKHLPTYIESANELFNAGAEIVAIVAANDGFVMDAWRNASGAKQSAPSLRFLGDSSAELARALNLQWSASENPFNTDRSQRYSLVIDGGKARSAEPHSSLDACTDSALGMLPSADQARQRRERPWHLRGLSRQQGHRAAKELRMIAIPPLLYSF